MRTSGIDPWSGRRSNATLRRSGFTLMELLVVLMVMTVVIVGALTLLDSTSRITNQQVRQVEMQQSLRAAQTDLIRKVRHAGIGGLPASTEDRNLPLGMALSVINNVTSGTTILGDGSSPDVKEDTDVLTVRGVFNSPVYQVNYTVPGVFALDTTNGTGTVEVEDVTPMGAIPQDLGPLEEAITKGKQEAIFMVSATSEDIFGVVEFECMTWIQRVWSAA